MIEIEFEVKEKIIWKYEKKNEEEYGIKELNK